MNKKIAAVGILLVFAAVAVGSGAFTSGDEVTNSEAEGSVFFSPADSPNGDAYAEFDDGEITVSVERLNPNAETLIDELFEVGYEGEDTAEVWIEHPSDSITFYDAQRSPVENEVEEDRIVLDSGEVEPVGMSIDTREPVETIEEVTLVALIPTSEEDDIIVNPPPDGDGGDGDGGDGDGGDGDGGDGDGGDGDGGDGDGGDGGIGDGGRGDGGIGGGGSGDGSDGTDTDTGQDSGTTGPGEDRARLYVDLGRLNVRFRQPNFEYTTDVSDRQVGISPGVVSEGLATVVDEETPTTEESIAVKGIVENTGNSVGTALADLRINGRSIESREVELGPGENTTVDFALAFSEPGQYEVAVGDSEPVTVVVTEEGIDLFPWAFIAAILSLLFLLLLYRRLREEEEEEEQEEMVDVEE